MDAKQRTYWRDRKTGERTEAWMPEEHYGHTEDRKDNVLKKNWQLEVQITAAEVLASLALARWALGSGEGLFIEEHGSLVCWCCCGGMD